MTPYLDADYRSIIDTLITNPNESFFILYAPDNVKVFWRNFARLISSDICQADSIYGNYSVFKDTFASDRCPESLITNLVSSNVLGHMDRYSLTLQPDYKHKYRITVTSPSTMDVVVHLYGLTYYKFSFKQKIITNGEWL
jgi:hypothetical protein